MESNRSLLLALCCVLLAPSAGATMNFIEWTSINEGSGGGIMATLNSTVNTGTLTAGVFNATDPAFTAAFSDEVPVLRYISPISGTGDILSSISFSSPLPAGSRLLIIDADVRMETALLNSGGTPLTLLEQTETWVGALSTFPGYDAGLGRLVAAGFENDNEASIFDLSGLSTINVDFSGGGLTSAIFAAVAVPVPLPAALYLLGPALAVLGFVKRKT